MIATASFVLGMFVMQVIMTTCAVRFSERKNRLEVLGMTSAVSSAFWLIETLVVVYHYSATNTEGTLHMWTFGIFLATLGITIAAGITQRTLKIGNTPASTRR
ncbi:MAG TPA: hypothetical protein VFQ70_02030 [Candidatus Saccharimonadaceae bacterium]|nr:hypothetical protein [Candidatus Saccharimonadaceae bacterium]